MFSKHSKIADKGQRESEESLKSVVSVQKTSKATQTPKHQRLVDLDKILVQDHRKIEYELRELLKKSTLNALYFGCSLSTPSKQFARKLNEFKRKLHEQKRSFQSILVSCDQSEKEVDAFYETLNRDLPAAIKHYRVKFVRPAIETLYVHFNVLIIPSVIILDSERIVITQYARGDIEYKGLPVYDDWLRMLDNY